MNHSSNTSKAKQQVLDWVRSKNPQAVLHDFSQASVSSAFCRDCGATERDADADCKRLGLQEFVMAFKKSGMNVQYQVDTEQFMQCEFIKVDLAGEWHCIATAHFYLTKNLHNQPEEFYQSILPLIHD